MKYIIKKVKYDQNKIIYMPIFADKKMQILEEFLMTEVKSFKNQILKIIEEHTDANFVGNICSLQIQNEIVKIENTLDDVEIGYSIELNFDEFA